MKSKKCKPPKAQRPNPIKQVMILVLIKLGFGRLSAIAKVEQTLSIVGKMTGNPNYPSPTPSLGDMSAAANELLTALKQQDGTLEKTTIKNNKEKALDDKMSMFIPYVQMASGGNKAKIESAGLKARDPKSPSAKPGAVTGVTIKLGLFVGSVDLKWRGFKNRNLYMVEARLHNSSSKWMLAGQTTKQKVTVSKLESNQIYDFRIICVNSAGKGPESETVTIRVY